MTYIRRCSFGAPHQMFASKITGPFGVIAMSHPIVRTGRRDDIPQVLCSLDILVSLSGGSVMYEAMSCGKAVISAGFSTKEDSVHIQDGRTGLLVSSGYPSDLARAMVQLIDAHQLRECIGREARRWAEKNFCHLNMAARTQKLYDRLIQRS